MSQSVKPAISAQGTREESLTDKVGANSTTGVKRWGQRSGRRGEKERRERKEQHGGGYFNKLILEEKEKKGIFLIDLLATAYLLPLSMQLDNQCIKASICGYCLQTQKLRRCIRNSLVKIVTRGLCRIMWKCTAPLCCHCFLLFLFVSFSLSFHLPVTQFCRTAAHIITCPTESLLWHIPECIHGNTHARIHLQTHTHKIMHSYTGTCYWEAD